MIWLPCRVCRRPAPVQWVKAEQRYRYHRHFVGVPQDRVRCPASGCPASGERGSP